MFSHQVQSWLCCLMCPVWPDSHPRGGLHGSPEHRPAATAERGLGRCQQYSEWWGGGVTWDLKGRFPQLIWNAVNMGLLVLSRCYLLCPAWRNGAPHGSQGRPGGGGQMSAEERSHGGCSSTGETPLSHHVHLPIHVPSPWNIINIPPPIPGGPDSSSHRVSSGENRDRSAAAAAHGPSWCCHYQRLHPAPHLCQGGAGGDGLRPAGGGGFTLTGYKGGCFKYGDRRWWPLTSVATSTNRRMLISVLMDQHTENNILLDLIRRATGFQQQYILMCIHLKWSSLKSHKQTSLNTWHGFINMCFTKMIQNAVCLCEDTSALQLFILTHLF